jgi:hypothetical protein
MWITRHETRESNAVIDVNGITHEKPVPCAVLLAGASTFLLGSFPLLDTLEKA